MNTDRNISRETYHWLRRAGIKPAVRVPEHLRGTNGHIHRAINERAGYRAILDRCVEDGKIGVIRAGMDCDCTQYYREGVEDAPSGAFAFARSEQQHEEWLDGPESTQFVKPSIVVPTYRSADRAMEAYEDGHPHIVRMGAL